MAERLKTGMGFARSLFRRASAWIQYWRNRSPIWVGDFKEWGEARKRSEGYESGVVFGKVKEASRRIQEGTAVYERDSVIFDEIQYSWPLAAALLWVSARQGNRLNILDFGGSLGSSYYQNIRLLSSLSAIEWCIVEQKEYVEYGKKNNTNRQIKYFETIDDCLRDASPDAILMSSVVQYLEAPYDFLEKVIGCGFKHILFDRTPFLKGGGDRISVQKVPSSIYKASYPAWFLDEEKFLRIFEGEYVKVIGFSGTDRANVPSDFKGFLFEKRVL